MGLAAATLAAQSQNPPFRLPAGVDLRPDLVYATVGSRDLHLDLFLPGAGSGPFPAVVYIHGGGWSAGNRMAFRRQAADMATKGFAGACIEYRLSQEAKYPAALHDSKAAVRWLRANAARFHIDGNRIGAAGGSAGGHLAAMLGTTAGIAEFDGEEGGAGISTRVMAVAAFNPALDFADFAKRDAEAANRAVTLFLGASYADKPELWKAASPVRHVNSRSAAFLFLHGDADSTVPYRQSVAMMEKLKAAGVRAELFTAPGAKHGFFNAPPWFQPALERMEQFFVSTLKP